MNTNNTVRSVDSLNIVTVVTDEMQVNVTRPVTNVVHVLTPGPQGPAGQISSNVATTGSNIFTEGQIIRGNLTLTGSVYVSGNIIPAVGIGQVTSSFDLGSATAAWRDIWVSNGSIKFISSGSSPVIVSAVNGGLQINNGTVISDNGVSGQFSSTKQLDKTITIQSGSNSLLMGPIDIELDKEIIVQEDSDLTIFGDIENVIPESLNIKYLSVDSNTTINGSLTTLSDINTSGNINTSGKIQGLLASSRNVNSTIKTSDGENLLLIGPDIIVQENNEIIIGDDSDLTILGDIDTQVATVDTVMFATNALYAVTASYVLNSSCSCIPFPYSGSAVITGSLVVNNGTNNVINTSNYQLLDSNGTTSVDWQNKVLKLAENRDTVDWGGARLNDYTSEALSVDWEGRILYDTSANQSIDWQSRIFYANDGATAHLDWSNPSYMQLTSISGSPITNVLGIDGSGRLYYTASSAVGGGSTPNLPGGVEGSIQFNNSIGDFGGTQKFTYNASSHSISLTEFIPAPFGITENKGQYSILQGREGKVLGNYGVSLVGAYALDTASVAIGYGVIASGSYQVAVGRQNASNNTSSIFIVGVGSGKDGFTVEADASVRAHVTIPVNSTNPTNPKSGSMYVFQSGSNYYINVYVGGRWRSASLA